MTSDCVNWKRLNLSEKKKTKPKRRKTHQLLLLNLVVGHNSNELYKQFQLIILCSWFLDDLGIDDFEDMNLQDFIYFEFDIGDSLESELNVDEVEVSVGNILKTAISEEIDENGMRFNYNRSTLCEDIPCVTHSLYLVATADFKTVIDNCRSGVFKKPHEQAFGKLQKLWNLSNRSVKASELIYESLGNY